MNVSVVLFEEGQYLGYGFLPNDEAINNPGELKEWILDGSTNRDVHQIVWSYLRKNKVEKVHSVLTQALLILSVFVNFPGKP